MIQFAFKERLGSILMCSQGLNSIMIHFQNISNYMSQKLLFDLNSSSSNISQQITDAHQSLFVGFLPYFSPSLWNKGSTKLIYCSIIWICQDSKGSLPLKQQWRIFLRIGCNITEVFYYGSNFPGERGRTRGQISYLGYAWYLEQKINVSTCKDLGYNKVIINSQHEFVKSKSCQMNLISSFDRVIGLMDNRE